MKSKLNYFCLFWRKHSFSTPTHDLVSDCRLMAEAGIAERSCYTPVDAAPLQGFSGAAVAALMGKEKWRQGKVAARPPLSSLS